MILKEMFFRCGLKVFSTLRAVLFWLSEKALDAQLYCSRRSGYAPF